MNWRKQSKKTKNNLNKKLSIEKEGVDLEKNKNDR